MTPTRGDRRVLASRRVSRSLLVVGALVLAGLAGPAGAAVAGTARAQAIPSAGRISGDDGRRSFGVQPAGPAKPDPRPNLTYLNVKPGQRLRDHVALINVSDRPVTLSVYAADGYNTPSGGFDLLTANKKSTDLGSWVHLTRSRATVPARSALITPIEVRIPRNAEPGDHAAGIVVSLKSLAKDRKGSTVTVDQRVGTRMYVRVSGKLRPRIELDRSGGSYHGWASPLRGPAEVTYTIRNTGNVRLVGTQSIRVTNLLGGATAALAVPPVPELLPGNSFSFTSRVDKILPTFLNTAHVTVDPQSVTGNVDPALAQASVSARFWTVSWPFVVLLLLLAGFGVRYWRRRRSPTAPDPDGPGDQHSAGDRHGGSGGSAKVLSAGTVATVLAVTAVLTGLCTIALPQSARADSGGTLTFIPGKGADTTPMWAVTSGGCPAAAAAVIGTLYGKGLPKEGIGAIPNSTADGRHEGAFGIPPQDTLYGLAQTAGITLSGPYRLVVRCTDQFATRTYARFTGTITFGTSTKYTAPVPKTPPSSGVPEGYLGLVFPKYRRLVQADAKAAAVELRANARTARATAAPAALVATPASGSSFAPSGVGLFGGVLLLVLVLGGAGYLFAGRGRPATAGTGRPGKGAGTPGRVSWPDEDQAEHDHPRLDRS